MESASSFPLLTHKCAGNNQADVQKSSNQTTRNGYSK